MQRDPAASGTVVVQGRKGVSVVSGSSVVAVDAGASASGVRHGGVRTVSSSRVVVVRESRSRSHHCHRRYKYY